MDEKYEDILTRLETLEKTKERTAYVCKLLK